MSDLETDLNAALVPAAQTVKHESELAEFVRSVGEVLARFDFDQKSNITPRNSKGMHKVIIQNGYTEKAYGFRIIELDLLVKDKMARVLSIKGEGSKRIIELFKAIKPEIQSISDAEKMNRMMRRG